MTDSPAGRRIDSVDRANLTFDVIDSGPVTGVPVVLLHGFPERAASWGAVARRLHDADLRTYALDQRGYSPGARPTSRFGYRIPELAADTCELIDRIGKPVHLVGHDWGAVVAWAVASRYPAKVRSLTAISVPHPSAFLRSMVTSTQGFRSWYMLFFQIPWLAEFALSRRSVASFALRRAGMSAAEIDDYFARIVQAGALRGGLGWYRSLPLNNPGGVGKIDVPVTYIWSTGDIALGRKGAVTCERWVNGPYRLEIIADASHWLVTQRPDEVADLVIARASAS